MPLEARPERQGPLLRKKPWAIICLSYQETPEEVLQEHPVTIDLTLHLIYPLAMRIEASRVHIVSLAPDVRWGLRS